jgi:NAD(P)-dependent dehydrogenase (short-subunit alcohol dehydrogenase family)
MDHVSDTSDVIHPAAGPDDEGAVVVLAGTAGLGRTIAELYARRGRRVVLSGRELDRARRVAAEIGGATTAIAVDLSAPSALAGALADVGAVRHLVLVAGERDHNTVEHYDVRAAVRLATMKIVGYTEVVHCLRTRMQPGGSIVLFGGLAKERPYPGSTTISTLNDAMVGLTRTLARELAPLRVNSIHPGIVGDHPEWSTKPQQLLDSIVARTPLGRLITSEEVALATAFLTDHPSVNATHLALDGGWLVT